jgi:hypothetical protein
MIQICDMSFGLEKSKNCIPMTLTFQFLVLVVGHAISIQGLGKR